ncbi:MAG: TIGR03960 family B12-binding radical SAM protein [Synergistales bacterium]|nr:TIGR03960 family B12-binding radical SAM protein [Synergistales bacterium]
MLQRYPEFGDPLRALLSRVRRPARYIGGEHGAPPPKGGESDPLRVCLAFPDVYEVGMSFLGYTILYQLIRRLPFADAERAYCPWVDMEAELRSKGWPLVSLEGERPLCDFDVVGFSLQYELNTTNILTMLDLGGIPLRAERREDGDPLVIAGGPGALAPEASAPFFDAIVAGDAEELLPELLWCLRETRGAGREERLEAAARLPGLYVPLFSRADAGGAVRALDGRQTFPVRRRIVEDLERAFLPDDMVVPTMDIVHDRAAVEAFRGCTRGCRFCQAGMVYRPVRERSPEVIADAVRRLAETTGYDEIGLVSLATCDYSELEELLGLLEPWLRERNIRLSLPSLRVDAFSVELAARLDGMRKSGLTFAPEAGTQRLRDVINKGVTDDAVLDAAERAFAGGWEHLKLYFMMGLPTETDEELEAIVKLARQVQQIGARHTRRARVHVSVAGFVPKPHTPFQWEAQNSREELRRKGRFLQGCNRNRKVAVKYHEPEQTVLEGAIARGGRRIADVIEAAWRRGARFDGWSECFDISLWDEAFAACGVDPAACLAERSTEQALPWDHIDTGVDKAFLLRERERAYRGAPTGDCRWEGCNLCGLQGRLCPVPGEEG